MSALAAGDARRDPQRLVFKGGTMLRVCGLPDYRFSEDLDFDWMGSPPGFRVALAAAVVEAAGAGAFVNLAPGSLR